MTKLECSKAKWVSVWWISFYVLLIIVYMVTFVKIFVWCFLQLTPEWLLLRKLASYIFTVISLYFLNIFFRIVSYCIGINSQVEIGSGSSKFCFFPFISFENNFLIWISRNQYILTKTIKINKQNGELVDYYDSKMDFFTFAFSHV